MGYTQTVGCLAIYPWADGLAGRTCDYRFGYSEPPTRADNAVGVVALGQRDGIFANVLFSG